MGDRVGVDTDRELRKEIAGDAAADKADRGTIFTRAFQFFLVPAIIVSACVGVFAFFTYVMTEQRSAQEWVRELKQGGPNARKHAAVQLVAELRRMKPEECRGAGLYDPLLEIFNSTGSNEPAMSAPLVGQGPTMRALLAECLGLVADPRASPVLIEALKEEKNAQTIASCIGAIGAMRDRDAAPELIKLLDHSSSVVRKYATFNLGAVAAPDAKKEWGPLTAAVEPLRARLKDSRPEVQWNAAFVLAYFLHDAAGAPVLRQMLDRTFVTQIVTSTAKEQGDVGTDTAANAPSLVAHVLKMACQGACMLGDRSFEQPLQAVVESDPDGEVRSVARKAIDVLKGKK